MNLISQRSNREEQSKVIKDEIKFDFEEYMHLYAFEKPG